jgi:hypothetical protein
MDKNIEDSQFITRTERTSYENENMFNKESTTKSRFNKGFVEGNNIEMYNLFT